MSRPRPTQPTAIPDRSLQRFQELKQEYLFTA